MNMTPLIAPHASDSRPLMVAIRKQEDTDSIYACRL